MVYLVACKLSEDPRTDAGKLMYANLLNAVTSLGPWSDRLGDSWIVESKLSASRIRDLLKPHVRGEDRLFVAQFNENWASHAMGKEFPAWMRRRDFTTPAPIAAAAERARATSKRSDGVT